LLNTAVQYNNAFLVIENASMGHHVVMKIIELDYKNIYWTIKDLAKIHESNADSQLYYDPYNPPKNAVPGFTTSSKSRPAMIARLEEDIRQHDIILHSNRLFKEIETFIYHNGKPQALDSYNDDLIMALAMGMYVRFTTMRFGDSGESITKQLLGGMDFAQTPYEFGITQSDNKKIESTFVMDLPNGQKEDLRWML
jgi:hypothetical protein